MDPRSLRRTFLWLFLGFLVLTALLAIVAVLGGEFGDLQARVLASSASVSAASVCAMACAAFRERGRVPALGSAGIALAALALGAALVTIWSGHRPDESLVKTTLLLVVWAVGVAHAELLALPPLADRLAWVQIAAVAAIALLAVLLSALILGEYDGEAMGRTIGVVAILVCLVTLAVPILWKIGGIAGAAAGQEPLTLALRRTPDGHWVDAGGGRYEVRRIDDVSAP